MGLVVIMFFFGLAGGIVGKLKGSSFFVWFLISGTIPFLGLLTAVCWRLDNEELRRQCPGCGKIVKLHDAVCMSRGTKPAQFARGGQRNACSRRPDGMPEGGRC